MKFRFLTLTLGLVMALASVSVFAENAPIDNDAIAALIPALPENGSGADYLGYIHGSQKAKTKAIETLKAKAQENGQQFTQDNVRAVESAFIQKNIEAATKGMEIPHCPESVYANLAVFKAQFLFVKWQLLNNPSGQTELNEFIEQLKADGKDTTLQHVMGKINGLKSQINVQSFRGRLVNAVNTQNAEEIGKLVNEMNATLAAADNGKNATPEMAQNALTLSVLVQKVPAYKPTENLFVKYLNILSNATNPETKKIVDNVKQQIANAIKAAQEKERQKQEEQKKKEEEQKKQEEQVPEQKPLPDNLI